MSLPPSEGGIYSLVTTFDMGSRFLRADQIVILENELYQIW